MDTRSAGDGADGDTEVIALPPKAPADVITTEGLATDLLCFPTRDQYFALVMALKDDDFEMCVDVCGVDYLEHRDRALPDGVVATRFEVVANFLSLVKRQRVRVRVQAGDAEPEVASLFTIYPGTEALERETFDLMGI